MEAAEARGGVAAAERANIIVRTVGPQLLEEPAGLGIEIAQGLGLDPVGKHRQQQLSGQVGGASRPVTHRITQRALLLHR